MMVNLSWSRLLKELGHDGKFSWSRLLKELGHDGKP